MKDHSHDDLSKFLKSKLNDSTPAENAWNVPPQSVFNEAISEINTRKQKKNRFFLLISILGLATFLIIGTLMYSNSYIKSMEQKLSKLESSLLIAENKSNNTLQEINREPQNSNKNIENTDAKIITDVKLLDLQNQLPKKAIYKIEKGPSNINSQSTLNRFANTFDENRIEKNTITESPNNVIAEISNGPLSKKPDLIKLKHSLIGGFPSVNALKGNLLFYNRDYLSLNLSRINVKQEQLAHPDKSWKINLLATQNFTCLSMTNMAMDPDINLLEYDNRYRGQGLQLNLSRTLTKTLTLNLLTAYNKYNNESVFTQRDNYNTLNENDHLDGSADYDSDVYVMTPLGTFTTQSNFSVAANTYTDQDVLNNETKIIQSFNVFSLGLGIDAQLPISSKVNLFIGTAGLYNRIVGLNNSFDTTMEMNGLEMDKFKSNPTSSEMSDISNAYLSLQFQIGMRYVFNNQLDFILSSQANHSLSSLRKTNVQNAPATYIHNLGINAGVGFKF